MLETIIEVQRVYWDPTLRLGKTNRAKTLRSSYLDKCNEDNTGSKTMKIEYHRS